MVFVLVAGAVLHVSVMAGLSLAILAYSVSTRIQGQSPEAATF